MRVGKMLLLFVVFRYAPHYKKRFKNFFLFYIATLAKNHIFQFLPFRSYRVVIWCSSVVLVPASFRYLQGYIKLVVPPRPCIYLLSLCGVSLLTASCNRFAIFLKKKFAHLPVIECATSHRHNAKSLVRHPLRSCLFS